MLWNHLLNNVSVFNHSRCFTYYSIKPFIPIQKQASNRKTVCNYLHYLCGTSTHRTIYYFRTFDFGFNCSTHSISKKNCSNYSRVFTTGYISLHFAIIHFCIYGNFVEVESKIHHNNVAFRRFVILWPWCKTRIPRSILDHWHSFHFSNICHIQNIV